MQQRKGLNDEATTNTQDRADAETVRPTACTYCRRTDVDIHIAAGVDKPACETCAEILQRALEIRAAQAEAKTERELPPTVEARAHDVSVSAYLAFKSQWQTEMAAHENERQAISTGTVEPAAWLAEDPCDPWCVGGLDHDNSTHPSDRAHYGASFVMPLLTMEPVVVCYPERWAQPELMMSLDRRYREKEARVAVNVGDTTVAQATLDEAEKIAHTLLDLVAQARGKTSST